MYNTKIDPLRLAVCAALCFATVATSSNKAQSVDEDYALMELACVAPEVYQDPPDVEVCEHIDIPVVEKTTEEIVHDYFDAKGMSEYGIAGLMGNLFAESGLNPINLENHHESRLGLSDQAYTDAVDSGTYSNFVHDKAGFGLAQWSYWSRKQGLLNLAHATNRSIGDLSLQLDFLWTELQDSFPSVLKTLMTADSVKSASNAVLLRFERPSSCGAAVQAQRAANGQLFFDQFAAP